MRPIALIASLCLAPLVPTARGAPQQDILPSQQNILIVLADDMGVDCLDAYGEGHDRPRTPVIDALAANGLMFRNAWACPSCSPARAALQTGRHGFRTGVGAPVTGNGFALQPVEVTLPELFDLRPELGYANAYFGKWHLGNESVGGLSAPNVAGWSHYAGWLDNLLPPQTYYDWPLVVNGSVSNCQEYITTKTVDQALAWIEATKDPWLCFVSFHAAHHPYHVPPARLHSVALPDVDPREDPRPFFRAIVEAMDSELGRLLAGLGDRLDHTTVIFAADNGTTKEVVVPPFTPQRAKLTPYEGGVNVPLIVHGPLVAAPGRESQHLVNLLDLFATVAEMAGIDPAATLPGVELDALSFLPVVLDPAAKPARTIDYSEKFAPNGFTPGIGIRIASDGRYKLLRQDVPITRHEFYDLLRDPFEQRDLLLEVGMSAGEKAAFTKLGAHIDGLLR